MQLISYIHPASTYAPCTGIGRHINNVLLRLQQCPTVHLQLLYSAQWQGPDGLLDERSPLRSIPAITFRQPENALERTWKLFDYPKVDRYLPEGVDWLYAPMQTYLPATKCPVAVTIQDIHAFEPDLPWSRSLHHRWFRLKWSLWIYRALEQCRIVFAGSEYTKQRMIQLLNAKPDKIVVAGNGVDLSLFSSLDISGASTEPPYVLVVGGLRRWKGADYVLAVADALRQRRSSLFIIVAGSSEEHYASAAQQYPNVILLGKISDEELRQQLRSAVALLFLSPYEGFGIPALEAMASGAPVVAANRASLPEVVGDAGILVPPESAEEIADILENLERDAALRRQYVTKGLQRAPLFTWDKCAERVLQALERYA